MCCVEKERGIRMALKSLCLGSGWSYGVFWRFDLRNPMLLTLEDSYCEDYAKTVTDALLLKLQILGEGIIGQAALDGKHRWLYPDSSTVKCSSTGHGLIQENTSDFSCEFSSGIKTIAVVPVESYGVLQFGSVRKILETQEFVDRTVEIFRTMGIVDGLVPSGIATSSLINDNFDHIDQFDCLISSYNQFPTIHSQTNAFEQNVLPVPSISYLDHQGDVFGFQNQQFALLFDELSPDLGFGEINFQEQCATVPEPTINDELLQCLVADLPPSIVNPFSSVKTEQALEDGSTMLPKKGLFSELGLDQILTSRADSGSHAKSSVEDQTTGPKKRKVNENWMIKCFNGDAKSCVTDQTQRAEESCKATKKRARPGESNRPRPKDRQMIQDRIKELRDIIPNGAKCSIDALLDRTIKHMLFMQGVAKNVEKLKRVDEAKAQRDVSNDVGCGGSAAWAIDVGGQNPIIVEDLGHSGLMLIEMVCEQHGFFLEIADAIRGIGLTILKGVVESQDDKVRAQFIVEAKRHVTRMEVLMSLLHLLKDTSSDGLRSVVDVGDKTPSAMNNSLYRCQPITSLPVGF